MRVFVTGATGFIGSAVVQELIGVGHQVLGLVRSAANAARLAAMGAEVQLGSLQDSAVLARAVNACDGVIHTAFNHDFVNVSRAAAAEADELAIDVMGAALAGTTRPIVVTTAVGIATPGETFLETDVPDPSTGTAHRMPAEHAAKRLAARGVRSSVIRLPPSVHGDGDYAFVPVFIKLAREKGVSAYVGEGENRWPAVHRLDAARLFRLALEKGAPGSVFHGIADEGITTRALAEIIGKRLHVPVVSQTPAEAEAHFTWLASFFQRDVPASSALTRAQLGWHPTEPGLIADLEHMPVMPLARSEAMNAAALPTSVSFESRFVCVRPAMTSCHCS